MTESAAICQYLAARYSQGELDVGLDDAHFGTYLNYLHFGEADIDLSSDAGPALRPFRGAGATPTTGGR